MKGKLSIAAVLLALAGCGADPAPMPLAASGPVEVRLGGMTYLADLQPTVKGQELRVTRESPAFGYDEGGLAKQVALQFCAGRGSSLDTRALGRFVAGAWLFDGGCV